MQEDGAQRGPAATELPAAQAAAAAPAVLAMAPFIDHTLLRPQADGAAVARLCDEAVALNMAAVCVNGGHVALAARRLAGTAVAVAATVGFPLGACGAAVKAFAARQAVDSGAAEIDVVLDLGALLAGDEARVAEELAAVVAAAAPAVVKVILETCLLHPGQRARACLLARAAGAAFVKTSTGFGGAGATVDDVVAMRGAVGCAVGVKASGGIRSAAAARRLLAAGATRLGCSGAPAWLQGPAELPTAAATAAR